LAKDHPLDTIESFGLAIGEHFLGHYAHVSRCVVSLEERVWSRLAESA
jgi:urate oxidase